MSGLRTNHTSALPSWFVRIGGVAALAPLVAALYERVRADPELGPYFEGGEMLDQARTFGDLLSAPHGGQAAPWLVDLAAAHRARGISGRHYTLLCAHLIDVLEEAGLDGDEADELIEWVVRARSAVVAG